jgi:predicted MFS family arabinose efflux permease
VDVATLSLVISVRSSIAIFAPVLGSIADQRGRRFGMLLGIFLFIVGMSLVAIAPSFMTFSIALLLGILSKYLFDPSMQAYFGDRVPYERRGTALAVTEAAWSLSFIAGIPLIGFLISRFGWNSPFPLLTGLGLVMLRSSGGWFRVPSMPEPADSQLHEQCPRGADDLPALAGISMPWSAPRMNWSI